MEKAEYYGKKGLIGFPTAFFNAIFTASCQEAMILYIKTSGFVDTPNKEFEMKKAASWVSVVAVSLMILFTFASCGKNRHISKILRKEATEGKLNNNKGEKHDH
jgi:hypothetical protein